MARNISSVAVTVEIAVAGSWKSRAWTPLLGKRGGADDEVIETPSPWAEVILGGGPLLAGFVVGDDGTTAGPRLGSWVVSAGSSVILRNLKS
jgi:hypothetical protein